MSTSSLHPRRLSPEWQFALVGALVSLPITVLITLTPTGEADIAGGILLVGPLVAGGLAAVRVADPETAGLRAGLLSAFVAVLTMLLTEVDLGIDATAGEYPVRLDTIPFLLVVSLFLCVVAPLVGLCVGRIGGWVVRNVAGQ
jgi:hypothetical protein